jgi:metal-responsive CopG/Arc/MetJ family transcriptional regulator
VRFRVSIPDAIFDAAERAARELGVSRSRLYSDALVFYVRTCSSRAITARLNQVYATRNADVDPALTRPQFETLFVESW